MDIKKFFLQINKHFIQKINFTKKITYTLFTAILFIIIIIFKLNNNTNPGYLTDKETGIPYFTTEENELIFKISPVNINSNIEINRQLSEYEIYKLPKYNNQKKKQ